MNKFRLFRLDQFRAFITFLVLFNAAHAADLDLPPPGAFTIVVIPDTQGYRGRGTKSTPESTDPVTNPVFENHTRWIAENLGAQNIVFVTHVGDIVDISNHDQWKIARHCLDRLHGHVPYGLTVGNHDMQTDGNASLYQRYFGADRFEVFPWYGGCFEPAGTDQMVSGNNVNSYQLFSTGSLNFIHFNLECNAPDNVLAWAAEVLDRHAGRHALISTHMDLGIIDKPKTREGYIHDPKGRMRWTKIHGSRGNSGEEMWDKLYRSQANLAFIFSGDQSRVTALRQDRRGDHGNMIVSLLSDYTSSGPLRLYRFLPTKNKVQVITYDTTLLKLVESTDYVQKRENHQFSLDFDVTPGVPQKFPIPESKF